MVDPIGHVGMALLWLSVGWARYDRRAALGFVALGVPFGLLPDVDLWLRAVLPTVKHHGVTHTALFATLVAVFVGTALGRWLLPWMEERCVPAADVGNRYVYAVGAVWVAGLSHVFGDVLSAPDVAEAVEPFWPLSGRPVGLDVVYYDDPVFNWGLLLAGAVLIGILWRRSAERPGPAEASERTSRRGRP